MVLWALLFALISICLYLGIKIKKMFVCPAFLSAYLAKCMHFAENADMKTNTCVTSLCFDNILAKSIEQK